MVRSKTIRGGVLAAVVGVCAAACDDPARRATTVEETDARTSAARDDGSVDPGDIVARPAAYYGRDVQVRAEVEDVLGPGVFTLDEDAAFAGPDVLVIAPPASERVTEDTEVTVNGTVRPLVVTEVERDYEWFDRARYDGDLLLRFSERPIVIASSVRGPQGIELVRHDAHDAGDAAARAPSADDAAGRAATGEEEKGARGAASVIDGEKSADAASAPRSGAERVGVAAITSRGAELYGKQVRVQAAVAEVMNPHAFTMNEPGSEQPEVLVLVPRGAREVRSDDRITVTGALRRFATERMQSDYPWAGKLLSPDLATRFHDGPVVVADSVQSAAGDELAGAEASAARASQTDRTADQQAAADSTTR